MQLAQVSLSRFKFPFLVFVFHDHGLRAADCLTTRNYAIEPRTVQP
jgi:hypothetical protein